MDNIIFWLNRILWSRKLKQCGKSVKFWKNVVIHSPSLVSIGNDTGIGDFVVIWGGGGVEIGEDVLIATHSIIISQTHGVNAVIFKNSSILGKIIIEDNVWIGAGVIVLPNVTVGRNSVIGAGSIVTQDIPANSIAVGSPAKVVSKREIK